MVKRTFLVREPEKGLLQTLFGGKYDFQIDILNNLEKRRLGSIIDAYLKNLTYIECQIIKMRYGLDEPSIFKIEEIKEVFNVSSRFISQTRIKALEKLRFSGLEARLDYFFKFKS